MKTTHLAQVEAIPVRGAQGAYEVLTITSRDSGRWIIPKGWPMKGKKDHAAAAREAFEEAGVAGRVHKRPLGAYTYDKRIGGEGEPVDDDGALGRGCQRLADHSCGHQLRGRSGATYGEPASDRGVIGHLHTKNP